MQIICYEKLGVSQAESSSFLVEPRSFTSARHLTLFCAVHFAILKRLQVCWGLPLFHLPCGFHSKEDYAGIPLTIARNYRSQGVKYRSERAHAVEN